MSNVAIEWPVSCQHHPESVASQRSYYQNHCTANTLSSLQAAVILPPLETHRRYYGSVAASHHCRACLTTPLNASQCRDAFGETTPRQHRKGTTGSHKGATGAPLSQRFRRNEVKVVVVGGQIKVVAVLDQLLRDLAGSCLGRGQKFKLLLTV